MSGRIAIDAAVIHVHVDIRAHPVPGGGDRPGTLSQIYRKLGEMACEEVERSSVPFASFIADRKANGEFASNSFVLRGYVRHWLNNVWAEYDRVRLMDLIDARSSLRPVMPIAAAS